MTSAPDHTVELLKHPTEVVIRRHPLTDLVRHCRGHRLRSALTRLCVGIGWGLIVDRDTVHSDGRLQHKAFALDSADASSVLDRIDPILDISVSLKSGRPVRRSSGKLAAPPQNEAKGPVPVRVELQLACQADCYA